MDLKSDTRQTSSHPWINDNSLVGIILKLLNHAAEEGIGLNLAEFGSIVANGNISNSSGGIPMKDSRYCLKIF